jgi:hypothetical protein
VARHLLFSAFSAVLQSQAGAVPLNGMTHAVQQLSCHAPDGTQVATSNLHATMLLAHYLLPRHLLQHKSCHAAPSPVIRRENTKYMWRSCGVVA